MIRKKTNGMAALFALASFFAFSGQAANVRPPSEIRISEVDPLEKVLPGRPYGIVSDTVRVARGETATLQWVVESEAPFTDITASSDSPRCGTTRLRARAALSWAVNVGSSYFFEEAASDRLLSDGNRYPDPLVDDTVLSVSGTERAVLWAQVRIPEDARPGLYTGTIRLKGMQNGKKISVERPYRIQVYPVTLPEKTKLRVVNWYYLPSAQMNGGKLPERLSPRYWEQLEQVAEMAAAYGQNCWKIDSGPDVRALPGGGWAMDCSIFDRTVDLLRKKGNLQFICGQNFTRRGDDAAPMKIPVVVRENGTTVIRLLPPADSCAQAYTSWYFRTLADHLRSKRWDDTRSWLDVYAQHVWDEPRDSGLAAWEEIAGMIKAAAPEIRTMEAYLATTYDPDRIDILVPQLDAIERFAPQLDDRTTMWMYVCCYPRGEYANRFIELPLLKTRLLHWINYRYDIPGFLHWGLNYWDETPQPFAETANVQNKWSGGDSFVLYPGYRKVYPCVRLAAMRDGIDDYKLLELVGQYDPAQAKAFAARLVYGADRYDTDIRRFRKLRRDVLEYLAVKMEKH